MQYLVLLSKLIYLAWSPTSLALSPGELAPAFSLASLTDSSRVELSDLKGKVVYLDFWASWCAPCRISLPRIDKLDKELNETFGNESFEIVAISLDEKTADALKFLKRFPVGYTVLHDPAGKVAEAYQLPGMPTSFVIDQSGRISMLHVGFKKGDIDIIRNHIKKLLVE